MRSRWTAEPDASWVYSIFTAVHICTWPHQANDRPPGRCAPKEMRCSQGGKPRPWLTTDVSWMFLTVQRWNGFRPPPVLPVLPLHPLTSRMERKETLKAGRWMKKWLRVCFPHSSGFWRALTVYSTTRPPFLPRGLSASALRYAARRRRRGRAVNAGRVLTLGHGLEVEFATVASEAGHGASPHLEHVDAPRLEPADDHRVGLAPDGRAVIFRLVLLRREKKKKTWWICADW